MWGIYSGEKKGLRRHGDSSLRLQLVSHWQSEVSSGFVLDSVSEE